MSEHVPPIPRQQSAADLMTVVLAAAPLPPPGVGGEKVFVSSIFFAWLKSVKNPRNCGMAAVITWRLLTQRAFKLPLAHELLCSNAAACTQQVRGSSGGNQKLKLKNCREI